MSKSQMKWKTSSIGYSTNKYEKSRAYTVTIWYSSVSALVWSTTSHMVPQSKLEAALSVAAAKNEYSVGEHFHLSI